MAQDAKTIIIPSKIAKRSFPQIVDQADWEQVFWELKEGYKWPEGSEEESLKNFPESQTKSEQKTVLEQKKWTEFRLQTGHNQIRKTFVTPEIEEWLDGIKEIFQQAVRQAVNTSPYKLFRDNLLILSVLKPESESQGLFENYVAVELWRDFILGRFNLQLSPISQTVNDAKSNLETKLESLGYQLDGHREVLRNISGIEHNKPLSYLDKTFNTVNSRLDFKLALIERITGGHDMVKAAKTRAQQVNITRILLRDEVGTLQQWHERLQIQQLTHIARSHVGSHPDNPEEFWQKKIQNLKPQAEQIMAEYRKAKTHQKELPGLNYVPPFLKKTFGELLNNPDLATHFLFYEPNFPEDLPDIPLPYKRLQQSSNDLGGESTVYQEMTDGPMFFDWTQSLPDLSGFVFPDEETYHLDKPSFLQKPASKSWQDLNLDSHHKFRCALMVRLFPECAKAMGNAALEFDEAVNIECYQQIIFDEIELLKADGSYWQAITDSNAKTLIRRSAVIQDVERRTGQGTSNYLPLFEEIIKFRPVALGFLVGAIALENTRQEAIETQAAATAINISHSLTILIDKNAETVSCDGVIVIRGGQKILYRMFTALMRGTPLRQKQLIELVWPVKKSSDRTRALEINTSKLRKAFNSCRDGIGSKLFPKAEGSIYRFEIVDFKIVETE